MYRVRNIAALIAAFYLATAFEIAIAQNSCNAVVLDASMLGAGAKSVGMIKAGAHSFTARCTRPQVLQDLRTEACQLGAEAIVIREEKKPGAWRSCFTISAEAFQMPSNQSTSSVSIQNLRNLAMNGENQAQYLLGERHQTGEGLEKDIVEAYVWFNLAASQNVQKAVTARDQLEPQLTSAELATAQERSIQVWSNYYKLGAHRGAN